jgi:hypothetical protein
MKLGEAFSVYVGRYDICTAGPLGIAFKAERNKRKN